MEDILKVTCGIDWAERHHDIALVDDNGTLVAKARITESVEGFHRGAPRHRRRSPRGPRRPRRRLVQRSPDGLDTDLGTHRLGGAQAQHVALARVLLANPHTLVLDEATALLDPTTARRTEQALAATATSYATLWKAWSADTNHDRTDDHE